MKAVRIPAPGTLEFIEKDQTPLGRGGVRLKMEAIGICGSDIALMSGSHPYAQYPVIPGHELAGRVMDAPGQDSLSVGQLVAVRPTLTCGTCQACLDGRTNHCEEVQVLGVHLDGGMAEEMVIPGELVYPCASNTSTDQAALVEPTAVALHACRRAGLSPRMRVAIIGSGVIGMLVLQIARERGCDPILAIDRITERLCIAKHLGAEVALSRDAAERSRELSPDGFDVVFDMVGSEQTISDSIAMALRGGVIVPVALPHGSIDFDFEPLYRKELTIAGSRLYDGDFQTALTLVESGAVDPGPIITHHFALTDAADAFSILSDHPEEAIKVIVLPN